MLQPDSVLRDFNTPRTDSLTFPPRPALVPSHRVLKLRFIKRPDTQRITKCEVFDADTREVVGELFVSDVKMLYPANGGHPEARVRLISAWEDAYE